MARWWGGPVSGPLGGFVEGLLDELARQGYAARSFEAQVRLVRHLSEWMTAEGLTSAELTEEVLARFVADRRRVTSNMRSRRALVPLMGYLRDLGVAPPAQAVLVPVSPGEVLLERFEKYLSVERGLAAETVRSYVSQVRPFVAAFPGDGGWMSLSARQVAGYVTRRAVGQRPRSVRVGANALRALLRWMWLEQMVSAPLGEAVGPFAAPPGTAPPKALRSDEVAALAAGLPAERPARLRDEAMLALMLRLALRASEVARLRLDDINWSAGVMLVRGKRARHDEMPLPVDVGKALVAYLQRGRPTLAPHREVFLGVDAPHGPLGSAGVSDAMSRVLRRAGIQGPGAAHRLRHTAACGVLARGGGLTEVGQLLRHADRSAATTIYAKSDLGALAVLARPWPTGVGR